MSPDWEPWTFTAWGEDTLEHRQKKRALAEERELRLEAHAVDPRLIDVVWRSVSPRVHALIDRDLREVGWLDDLVVASEDDAVPLLGLEFEARGVVARYGRLYERTPDLETERDASWVWEELLGPGLREVARRMASGEPTPVELADADGGLDREGLLFELWQLGGPALKTFTEKIIGSSD